jgi:low temperature requirement protein LtrA
VIAIGAALGNAPLTFELGALAVAAMVTAFALFWLYFAEEEHLGSEDPARAFTWGYGHFLIFAAGAAAGAGFAVQVDVLTHHAHVGQRAADVAIAVPVAIYLAGLWLVRDRFCLSGPARWVLPAAAALALVAALPSHSLAWLAGVLVAAAALRGWLPGRAPASGAVAPEAAQGSLNHVRP